jgi:adenosine deaminase
MAVDHELLRRLPKVSLHDHLDGGLRPATIIELAAGIGYQLPMTDADDLGRWFRDAADSGTLVRYLETFDHTVAVLQTPQNLRRVAAEFVEDLAADGVVYGEVRWAPEQHTKNGMTEAEAIEAVRDGLADGMATSRDRGQQIIARQLVTSMRHVEPTTRIADLALRYRDEGVAGFDIAGAEIGFPPERFLPAFQTLKQANAVYTIHAGEASGVESIWAAVQLCSANRIGHGVRIIDDITFAEDGSASLGRVAAYVRDQQIPLELCPSSNVQTGAATSIAEHPIRALDQLGFLVTVNCDNQLMSGTRLSREFASLCDAFDYDLDDVLRLTLNAAGSAFLPWDQKQALTTEVIVPAYQAALA